MSDDREGILPGIPARSVAMCKAAEQRLALGVAEVASLAKVHGGNAEGAWDLWLERERGANECRP